MFLSSYKNTNVRLGKREMLFARLFPNVSITQQKREEGVLFSKTEKGKGKVLVRAKWPTRLELIPVSEVIEATRSVSTPPPPPMDGMLVQRRVTPNNTLSSLVPIYTPGWKEAL